MIKEKLYQTKIGATLYNIIAIAIALTAPKYILFYVLNNMYIIYEECVIYNVLVLLFAILFVFLFTKSTKISIITVSGICWAYCMLNSYIVAVRKTPIVPTDFYSIRSALTVSSNYDFAISADMVLSTIAAFGIIAVACFFEFKIRKYSFRQVLLTLVPLVITGYFVNSYSEFAFKKVDSFDVNGSNDFVGIINTFAANVKNMSVDKPEGYNKKEAQEILDSYTPSGETTSDLPNVVVIMNEAFTDFRYIGDIKTNVPFMPNFDSLSENTIKGKMQVSVFASNTCNTEFEFLTGNSLAFMPSGYIPFIRTITDTTSSICNTFSSLGYTNIGIHPYMPECWRRQEVYPLLGFDKFISGYDFDENHTMDEFKVRGTVDFGELDYVRNYISDKESYQRIIKEFEQKGDNKAFIFNVTMQNHAPYTMSYNSEVKLTEDYGMDMAPLEQYLSLVKLSDEAFGELIEYFRGVDEKTVVVLFGDHMPGIDNSIYEAVYKKGGDNSTPLAVEKYAVPFLIWANYDIEEDTVEYMSPNYLTSYLKEVIGIEKDSWDLVRDEANANYPALTSKGAYDKNGEWLSLTQLDHTALDNYKKITYGRTFDKLP